ncbi:MAG: type II secretion system F family protein [Syntrophales bacterium]|jgi:tight adherence protein C|nr:type II secretion system F family protein [Syntrophales bacterium]MDY0044749.1 type II secretion system F family protein [Syntrophales bacterium]
MFISYHDLPLLFAALVFLTICLFYAGILQYFRQKREKKRLMEKLHDPYDGFRSQSADPAVAKKRSVSSKLGKILGKMGKHVYEGTAEDYRGIRLRFLKAGLYQLGAPAVFWGAKIFLAVLLVVSFALLRISVFKVVNPAFTMMIVLFLAFLGYFLPDFWLRIRTDIRKKKVIEGMPDALDLLVVCVEAGMGLDAAIIRVGEEIQLSNRVVAEEFKILNQELRLGQTREAALRHLAMRTDSEEVRTLVTTLVQTEKFGTSVATALRVCSDSSRDKRFQRAEEMAAKMAVKLSIPLILFIFPSLFIAILGPAGIRVYDTFFK